MVHNKIDVKDKRNFQPISRPGSNVETYRSLHKKEPKLLPVKRVNLNLNDDSVALTPTPETPVGVSNPVGEYESPFLQKVSNSDIMQKFTVPGDDNSPIKFNKTSR